MLFHQKLCGFLFSTVVLFSLSGCATFAQQKQIKTECATSPVLITDLSTTDNHRTQLLTGEACPRGAI